MEQLTRPPIIPWDKLQRKLIKEWKPGEHVTLIGPTGSGKTNMGLALADICKYALIIATKRRDPLLESLAHKHFQTQDVSAITWTPEGVPVHRKVMYWPKFPENISSKERLNRQAVMIRKALDWAEKTGNWAILLDELMWVSRNLRLERELEAVWFQGRTQGVSLIGAAQRPTHVPRLAYSQATYFFLWQTADKSDLERLRDISAGFPRGMIESSVLQLDWDAHECLFVDTKRRELARVIGPSKL